MDYQTLTELIGKSKVGEGTAPSLNDIISGIQSQYQAIPEMPIQSALYGANRYISGSPQFGAIDVVPEYGALNQLIGPSFVPSAFDKSVYERVDTKKLSDLISQLDPGYQLDYGGFADSASPSTSPSGPNVSMTPTGPVANTINPTIGQVLGFIAGKVTGIPFMSTLGKMAIEQQNFNSEQAAMFSAIAQADTTNPANLEGITTQAATPTALGGPQGTGGAAAAAASAAAAAAAAAGHSDAAIGAASQAAANAAIGNASPAAQAQAASDAAASVDGGTTGPGSAAGIGVGSTTGINSMDATSDAAAGASGSAGACVIATHAVNSGAFTKREKLNAVKWCVRNLHGKWWGEAIRRGYRYCGNKAISRGKAANHYQEFKDYVNFGTGKKRTLKTGFTFVCRSLQFLAIGLFLKD